MAPPLVEMRDISKSFGAVRALSQAKRLRIVRKRVTIADVARRAGVSTGTVSHVLNGTASVRPDKRDRVEAAIRELSFRPNALARSLIARSRPTDPKLTDAASPRLITVGYTSVDPSGA
ncbi:MAG TPA: LacI family DNA-binding transcriptional regulator [Dongiaceae bacterium]|nr:LacI family DNA-binding transcriptional regulator [Dongiaceae bacterium]